MKITRHPARRAIILIFMILLFIPAMPLAASADEPASCGAGRCEVSISTAPGLLQIGNCNIERAVVIKDGKAKTSYIKGIKSGFLITDIPEEFALVLMDGTRISSNDFDFAGKFPMDPDEAGRDLIVKYHHPVLNIDAQVVFSIRPDDYVVRKYVRFVNNGEKALRVDSVTVEHFGKMEHVELGGMGQPVYIGDNAFAGLEFPAGYNTIEGNGEVMLSHYPGWELGKELVVSKTAVVGIALDGGVKKCFRKYVEGIRRKPESVVVYNSWFDVRRYDMFEKYYVRLAEEYRKHLEPFGVKLDSVVVDDGWQKMDTLWEPEPKRFPSGFEKLSERLQAKKSNLGLWMPLCGYGLSLPSSPPDGFEASPDGKYFCLAGENHRAALKKRMKELIADDQVNYFKHDFNFLYCTGKGPGWKPTDKQSFEANVDGEIDMLDYMHSLNPDLFLNVTSYMWLSPWWLPHADALWIASDDYGQNKTAPAIEQRDRSITYYDDFLYRRFITEAAQYPVYAIMTHGIIDGKYNRLGGERESVYKWADNAMFYLGRGVLMRELYLTPALLGAKHWEYLGGMLRWAQTKNDLFTTGEMQGGDPAKGAPYWFHFDDGKTEMFVLRNPGYKARDVSLKFRNRNNMLRVIYPYNSWYSPSEIDANGWFLYPMYDHEVAVLESVPLESLKRPAVLDVRSRIISQNETQTVYEISGLPKTFYFGIKSNVEIREVLLNGKKITPEDNGYYHADLSGNYDMSARLPMDTGAWTQPASGSVQIEMGSLVNERFSEPEAYVIAHGDYQYMPSKMLFDGVSTDAGYAGAGWSGWLFPLEYGTHTHTVNFNADSVGATPFATTSFNLDVMFAGWFRGATATLVIRHAPAPEEREFLPPAPRQDYVRYMNVPMEDRDFSLDYFVAAQGFNPDKRGGIKAAKVHIRVFGAKSDGPPRSMTVNGTPVAIVPHNSYPDDSWQDFDLDVDAFGLKAIRKENKFVIKNIGGSQFKFTAAALAVRFGDGSWVSTPFSAGVQYTGRGWKYAEGAQFGSASKPIMLNFR